MTIEQLFHLYDMAKWNETGKPPEKYKEFATPEKGKPRKLRLTKDGKLRAV